MAQSRGITFERHRPSADASRFFNFKAAPPDTSRNEKLLNELFEATPEDIAQKDVGLLNLLCAPKLPGSETLDVARCVRRLDDLGALVRERTARNLYRSRADPKYGHCEPMWRMALLVTILKQNCGVAYSPTARDELLAGIEAPFADSKEIFIHGMLGDDPLRRWGTCSSIPVLVVAVARRLGYPVRLALAREHVYARWEGPQVQFNIEASNAGGMVVHDDEHYRQWRGGVDEKGRASNYFFRTLSAAEEFALFIKSRVACLIDAARYPETLLWSARSLQFAPADPHFPGTAYAALDLTLKHRLRQARPEVVIPPAHEVKPFVFDANGLLLREEWPLFHTIVAHFKESEGDLGEARKHYELAVEKTVGWKNEERDFGRFLERHRVDLSRKGA